MSNQQFPTLPEPILRVIAGAEFLDRVQPDWVDLIDTSTLDIARNHLCVLGQLGKHLRPESVDRYWMYMIAVEAYGISGEQILTFGFTGELDEIPALTAAWVLIVEARRAMADIEADAVLDALVTA